MVSNVVILNAFARDIAHETGFAATLRALLRSFVGREDLSTTRPLVLVVLRDFDEAARDASEMPKITEDFAKRVIEIRKQVSSEKQKQGDVMNAKERAARLVC
jgi:tRNA U55 pseudouridine synthase TruB